MMKDDDLIFTGMLVTVDNYKEKLCGTLLKDHERRGYLEVTDICDGGYAQLSNDGTYITFHKSVLNTYKSDVNILNTLESKIYKIKQLEKEVAAIRNVINATYNGYAHGTCEQGKNHIENQEE